MIALRPATPDDCAQVWAWNFAPDVRAVSSDTRVVDLDEHARWYGARLQRPESPIWIVEESGIPVGVVRVDQLADGAGRISIALANSARGRGIGKRSIAAACERWARPVVAHVRKDNAPSRTAFEACGFTSIGTAGELVIYKRGTSMETPTQQLELWRSEFGKNYTDRNDHDNPARVISLGKVLAGIEPASTLEVGCNVGWNLTYLSRLGMRSLHGIEPQPYAVARARARIDGDPNISVHLGTAFDLPFGRGEFDLAFTSGVMIHISPADLPRAMDEIYRVAKKWIVAIEYDHPTEVEIEYRGHAGALWKRDHGAAWKARYPQLQEIRSIFLGREQGYDDCTAHLFAKPVEG